MIFKVQSNETGKEYVLNQNAWSGKMTLDVNGVPAVKQGKKTFSYTEDEKTRYVSLEGNTFTGLQLVDETETLVVLPKLTWYEILFAVLPLTLVFIGGAIGGALGGFSAVLVISLVRNIKNVFLQLFATFAITGIAYFLYFLIAGAILEAIS